MDYQTNEGRVTLPTAGFTDHTINIIKFPDLAATLVISRGQMEKGQTLEASFNAQMDKLAKTVPDFKPGERRSVQFGKQGDIEAWETINQFTQGKEKLHQYQLASQIPGTNTMLALSYGKTKPLDEQDAERWLSIKQSFEFTAE
jgi:hypothetical protein